MPRGRPDHERLKARGVYAVALSYTEIGPLLPTDGVDFSGQTLSMVVTLAWPPPSHMVWNP